MQGIWIKAQRRYLKPNNSLKTTFFSVLVEVNHFTQDLTTVMLSYNWVLVPIRQTFQHMPNCRDTRHPIQLKRANILFQIKGACKCFVIGETVVSTSQKHAQFFQLRLAFGIMLMDGFLCPSRQEVALAISPFAGVGIT